MIAPLHATTFTQWQMGHFTSEELLDWTISGNLADPDGDGIKNLLEYAFDLDPWVAEGAGLPRFQTGPSELWLTYRHRKASTDLFHLLETSFDLVNWSILNMPEMTGPPVDLGVVEERTLRAREHFPERQFLRLEVFNQFAPPEIFDPPSALTAEMVAAPMLGSRLIWADRSNVETGYLIEKKIDSGDWQLLAETGPDIPTFTDYSVLGSTEYSYRVSAMRHLVVSSYSNEVSILMPPDSDGDGIPDFAEVGSSWKGDLGTYPTDPDSTDTDTDGLPDGWEIHSGMAANDDDTDDNGVSDAFDDFDGDGLSNEEELAFNLNPYAKDTDGDSMSDDWELDHDFDPTNPADGAADLDLDGLSNALEAQTGSDPRTGVEPDDDRKVEIWIEYTEQVWDSENETWYSESTGTWISKVWEGPNSPSEDRAPDMISLSHHYNQSYRGKARFYFKNTGSSGPVNISWLEYEHDGATPALEQLISKSLELWTTSAIFEISYPATDHAAGIMRYRTSEVERESGFDDYLRHDPSATPSPPWLMVPKGQGYSNRFDIHVTAPGLQPLTAGVSSSALTLTPPTAIADQDITTLTVGATSEGDDAYVTMQPSDVKLVRGARYPLITLTVQPYAVTCTYPDDTSKAPDNLPTWIELQEYLNRIFGNQMNVRFTVNDYQPLTVSYDIGDPNNDFSQFPKMKGPNGAPANDKLDLPVDPNILSAEELAIYSAGHSENHDVCLYFIGTKAQYHWTVAGDNISKPCVGYARDPKHSAFVVSTGLVRTKKTILGTAAHEIGHLSLKAGAGLQHPRFEHPKTGKIVINTASAVPLLRNSDDQKRLMYSPAQGFDKSLTYEISGDTNDGRRPGLLIQDEWDQFRGTTTAP